MPRLGWRSCRSVILSSGPEAAKEWARLVQEVWARVVPAVFRGGDALQVFAAFAARCGCGCGR